MEIINLLGHSLAELTQKPELLCRGMIRIAIRDYFKQENPQLTYEILVEIIQNNLAKRISQSIPDTPRIITQLQKELREFQSILTIIKI